MLLAAGKKYSVNVHLGLVSVKFDASIGDWENGTPAEPDIPLAPPVLSTVYFTPDAISVPEDATSVTKPVLTIQGDDGSDLSGQASVVWESSDTDVATIDADGDITLLSAGTTNITARVTYGNVTKEASFALTVTSATPSVPLFRGYEISKGILWKDNNQYKLTDGNNQLETAEWIGKESSIGVYYHKWTQLKTDLGSDGNDIVANASALPSGWRIPSYTEWKAIMGKASGININGVSVQNGYALVQVTEIEVFNPTLGEKKKTDLPGILLIPDETNIICTNLNPEYIGPDFGHEAAFDRNLTTSDIESLTEQGCVFLPLMGCYGENTGGEEMFFGVPGDSGNGGNVKGFYLSRTGFLDEYDDTFVYSIYGYVFTEFDDYDPDYYDPDDVYTWLYYVKLGGYWLSMGDDYNPIRLIK
jgi:hypothetical protein